MNLNIFTYVPEKTLPVSSHHHPQPEENYLFPPGSICSKICSWERGGTVLGGSLTDQVLTTLNYLI